MKPGLIIVALGLAALGLGACADTYGYAYDYDPYLGPRGHYTSRSSQQGRQAPCAKVAYSGPYADGYGGTYYAGPYCLEPGAAVVAVAR